MSHVPGGIRTVTSEEGQEFTSQRCGSWTETG
jgi:hypothetical protein